MKPPKSIRNIVNTLLGNKKRSKSSPRSESQIEPSATRVGVLDKNGRHHRSADDLLEEGSGFECGRSSSAAHRSRSLPRRSQSCLSVQHPTRPRRESQYGARVVSGTEGDLIYEERPRERDEIPRGTSARTISRGSSGLPTRRPSQISRSESMHSVRPILSRRTQSTMNPNGFEEQHFMPRTTSWSHPQTRNGRTQSYEMTGTRRPNTEMFYDDDETIRSSESRLQHVSLPGNGDNLRRRGRFASHEQLFDEIPRTTSSASSRLTATEQNQNFRAKSHSGVNTEEKLKTCMYVLNRLSAQMEEIKNVSNRVEYVDNEVKKGTLHREGARERRLRELDQAKAASQRLKSMLKSKPDEVPKSRLSSQSSGYDSGTSSRRSSSSPQHTDMARTARPPSRVAHDRRGAGVAHGSHNIYGTPQQPYPQSVSDMVPLWDAKDAAESSKQPKGPNMMREDSMSSGYATGSGSESPIATDADSAASGYSMRGHPRFRQVQHQHQPPVTQQQHWPAHYYHQGYNAAQYDPYSYHQGYHPMMSVDGTVGSENIYGNLEQIYGYASSSLADNDVYSNGWFQLPIIQQQSDQYSMHSAGSMMPYPEHQVNFNHGWQQPANTPQPMNMKYGGLADKFFDPSAQPTPTIMDNINSEYASESTDAEDSVWKSYGSFRYRNGQRTVLSTGGRKRKTVRFSQTVRQRVETEESEMEDSTSVIKGCDGDDNNSSESRTSDLGSSDYESSDIYMCPRQTAQAAAHSVAVSNHGVNPLPEPIYEFPSGHIESSCMCPDCILARGSCQMHSPQVAAYY